MTTTVGIFLERQEVADLLWNQCDGPYGRHGDLQIVSRDARADHVLVIGTPFDLGEGPRRGWWLRLRGHLRKSRRRPRLDMAWDALEVPRERTSVLFYEPRPLVRDTHYATAQRYARRVFGTDPRAPNRIVLPSIWLLTEDVHQLRSEEPPADKPVPLAAVITGRRVMRGHEARLGFLERLRAADVPFELFGRGLSPALASQGPVGSKRGVLRPARYVLALENHVADDGYVTEKLWDPLLTWSLPLYHGSGAAGRVLPDDAVIRLPDLEDGGVETVREALAHPEWWDQRLEAIAEARRRILGDLRMIEWIRRCVVGGSEDWPPAFNP